jgi:hypothetical protein
MRIETLRVVHLAKGPQAGQGVGARLQHELSHLFHLDSCQRLLWVCGEEEFDRLSLPSVSEIDVFEGVDAYRFLLRVSTGLESQIVGETDIFGQLKEAWRKMEDDTELGALMQRVFEDTKDIRSRYLQNLGGASYGSLVRMMLKQSPGPTLVVGAGQLAQAVAPYLLDQELWIFNRSAAKLADLHAELVARVEGSLAPRIRVISEEEEAMAWRKAASVVVCIPMDAARDSERAAWRLGCEGPVIHLGGSREEAGVWNRLPTFEALDDLFALQKSQGDVRMTQVAQAARACDEKAKLRALGSSVTLPHGWEDLAVFA